MDDQGTRSRQQAAAERSLVLLRHAKSDWTGNEPDQERPLARRGRKQAPVTGRWLAESIKVLDLTVVSPAARARGTWDLVAAELGAPVPVRVDDRIYNASADELLAVVRDLPESAHTVVVVGHNPGLEDLVLRLTGERITLKTSAIAVMEMSGGWATAGHSSARLMAAGRPLDAIRTGRVTS